MEVRSKKKFRKWLEGQPQEVCAAIAWRAAMRVLPPATQIEGFEGAERLALAVFRVSLISGVAALRPHPDAIAYAASAGYAADAAALAAQGNNTTPRVSYNAARAAFAAAWAAAAASVNDAASCAAHASEAVEAAAFAADTAIFAERNTSIAALTSTSIGLPPDVRAAIAPYRDTPENALNQGGAWAFWAEWYCRAMSGDHLPWVLQGRIAMLPHDIWAAGPEAVAEEIRRIQFEFVSNSLPQAGGIAFNEEEGLFRKAVAEVARPPLLGATLAQVEGALEDVLADPSNGLHDRSREVQVLTRMLERFGNDPQRIEMDCTSVYGSLTRQLAVEELPPSEQNLALREAVNQVAEGIRATDPEIAENRRILSEVKLRNMGEEGIAALEEALPVLEAVSDAELGEEFREDVLVLSETLRLPDRPVLGTEERNPGIRAAYDEEIRLFKRIADMAILARTTEAVDKAAEKVGMSREGFLGILVGLAGIAVSLFA